MVNGGWIATRDAITNCSDRVYRGILLVVGVLTRITGAVFSTILLGAIFHIRWENGFFVSQGGWEWDLMMLAAVLSIIAAGPGRVSIAHIVKKIQGICNKLI